MENLPMEVIHSITFLSKTKNASEKFYDLILAKFKELDGLSSSKDGYNGELRIKTKKFKDKMELEFSTLKYDYEFFQSEMTDIIAYRNTDTVIYSLGRYHNFLLDYRILQKKTDKLCDLINMNMDKSDQNNDFVKSISLSKLYSIANYLNTMIIHIIKRLETVTGEKKEV